jgi:hypothetical protein
MAFDSVKRLFGIGTKSQEAQPAQRKMIDSEIDSLERDIQEYIEYTDSRKHEPVGTAAPSGVPEKFAQGGAIATKKPQQGS